MVAVIFTGTMVTDLLLVVVGVPSGLTAWHALHDRKARIEERYRRAADSRVTELVGTAFFGKDRSKWPSPDQVDASPPVTRLMEAVAHQVRPSNGTTVAATVEEIRVLVGEQSDQVKDLLRGTAALSVLVAEHVSDGHGGQRSW